MRKPLPFHDDLVAWRQDIHAHPELAFAEHRTAAFVADSLRSFGLSVTTGVGQTGVVATLDRAGVDWGNAGIKRRAIGLRADMDALPIDEANAFTHRSRHAGVMHACGHDGHTVMLLGAARQLAQSYDGDGVIHFIFQPAEEAAGGGKAMIDDGLFDRFPCDAVFGMHNAPGMPVGQFATRAGPFLAGFDVFDVDIIGKGTHAALPHNGIDPVIIAAKAIAGLPTAISKKFDVAEPLVFSVTEVKAGNSYNVIPDQASFRGGARHFMPHYADAIATIMTDYCHGLAAAEGAKAEVRYRTNYPPLVNTGPETDVAVNAARTVVGADAVTADAARIMGSEDFAFMLQAKPGCYILIGNGTEKGGCMVHNPLYDFNDDILSLGARYWISLVNTFFGGKA